VLDSPDTPVGRLLPPVLLLMCLPAAGWSQSPLAIENIHVIPMDREVVLRDHAVVVDAGRIVSITPMRDHVAPPGAQRVDGGGGYLLPGLVDSHIHLEQYMDARPDFGDAPIFLRHGVTSVINLRGFPEHLMLRDRIAAGHLLAPTLYTSGEFVNEPRVNTPAEAAAEVRAQAQAGYDVIKFRQVVDHDVGVLTTTGVDLETFHAMHAAARDEGLPVIGHAPHGLGLQAVLDNRHSLAHVGELVQLHFFPPMPPPALAPYVLALLLLTALAVAALVWRCLARAVEAQRAAATLARAAGGLLLLGGAGAGMVLVLFPGGLHYGHALLLWLLPACFVALLVLGVLQVLRARRRWTAPGAWRAGTAATGLCAILMGTLGLRDGVPLTRRGLPAEMDRVAARIRESGAWVGTTLIIYNEFVALRSGGRTRIAPHDADGLDPALRDRYLGARAFIGETSWRDLLTVEGLIPRYDAYTRELTAALHRAGVPLLAGTDAYGFVLVPPGRSMHAELELLVMAGIPPYHALRSATVEPARFLARRHEFGSITPGLRADMVLLAGNPLADIAALGHLRGVLVNGRWLTRETLDGMVDSLRAVSVD
jgi:cytosine/adenosine deaminase-related metal-dependent hydrolase